MNLDHSMILQVLNVLPILYIVFRYQFCRTDLFSLVRIAYLKPGGRNDVNQRRPLLEHLVEKVADGVS